MKLVTLLIIFFYSSVYAECIDDPYKVKTVSDLQSAVYCLQQEITILKKNVKTKEKVVHVVQVIATSKKYLALEVQESFKVYGHNAFVRTAINTDKANKDGVLYKVLIGPFEWRYEANQIKNNIRKDHKGFSRSFVSSIVLD